jgi:hypothetical protein
MVAVDPYGRTRLTAEADGDPTSSNNRGAFGRFHDGFYLRFAGGFGSGSDTMTVSDDRFGFDDEDGREGTAQGLVGATEVAVGATVGSGVAVGFGIYTTLTGSSDAPTTGSDSQYEFNASQLAIFSPFVDYYVLPNRGLHLQAGAGLATFVMGQGNVHDDPSSGPTARPHTALGLGILIGVGYEWWVSEEWGLGVLGRMTRGFTEGQDGGLDEWVHDTSGWCLLMSATYN